MMTKLRGLLENELALAFLVSGICFIVYLTTMCRTVSFIDAGELATVAALLGIAHPTGYPMFTLLAHCWLWLPLGGEEIVRLNMFAAAVTAAAVGVFFRVLVVLVRATSRRSRKEQGNKVDRKLVILLAAFVASLAFGLSATVWSQSVAIEVYGLHLTLLLLTMFFFLRGIEEVEQGSGEIPRMLVAAFFLLGLSFANHLTTLLILPALAFLYLSAHGLNRGSLLRAGKLAPAFFLGLSPYLFLPIRAAAHPPQQWGFPAGLERLYWHISGKQYRSWMFSSFKSAEKQLSYFFNHIPSEFNWILLLILLYGVLQTFWSYRRVFWFLVAAFLGCLLYAINYDIHDIDSYFLLAYISGGSFIFFGILALVELAPARKSVGAFVFTALVLMSLPASQYLANRREVSEADNYMVADYTHNMFANAGRNAVIISYQWDYFVASSMYFQLVRKERPDVVVIDKELLRRSWYFILLNDRFPWLIERSKTEVDAFLRELDKFEHDRPYDPAVIEARYVAMINSFITRSLADRPVYLGPEIEPEIASGLVKTPVGLLVRVSQPIETIELKTYPLLYRPSSIETRLTVGLRSLYTRMLTATAANLISNNHFLDAVTLTQTVLAIDPTYRPVLNLREQMEAAGRLGKK